MGNKIQKSKNFKNNVNKIYFELMDVENQLFSNIMIYKIAWNLQW